MRNIPKVAIPTCSNRIPVVYIPYRYWYWYHQYGTRCAVQMALRTQGRARARERPRAARRLLSADILGDSWHDTAGSDGGM